MSDFGWSYPPGCDGPPDDEAQCADCERTTEDLEDCSVCGEDDLCAGCMEEKHGEGLCDADE